SDSVSASSSTFWLTRSMKRISTRARRCGFHAAHSFWASTAPATAVSMSADEPIGTLDWTSPVLGFITSAVRFDCPAVRLPLMKCEICVVMSLPLCARYLDILVILGRRAQATPARLRGDREYGPRLNAPTEIVPTVAAPLGPSYSHQSSGPRMESRRC